MRLDKFFRNLQQDIKTFIFFLLLICLFRIAFICFFHDSLDASTANAHIIMANLAGMRLSMKSAGAIMAVGFISCTVIGGLIFPRINFYKLRLTLGEIGITLLTILLCQVPILQTVSCRIRRGNSRRAARRSSGYLLDYAG